MSWRSRPSIVLNVVLPSSARRAVRRCCACAGRSGSGREILGKRTRTDVGTRVSGENLVDVVTECSGSGGGVLLGSV